MEHRGCRAMGRGMKKGWLLIALIPLFVACKSKAEKCKDVCNDVAAEEHKDDPEWVKSCHALCDKATK